MNVSAKIQASHLNRQAVVYLRQSSPKQVLHHRESAVNQRALRERLLNLGWKKNQVTVVDEDQGMSGKHASGREGFQKLAADVGLGKVGILVGYDVSRLARNSADWHRLLELCALFDTLIGDTDGIYNPRDFNDRLLLGLKGTMSEAELHSLCLRLSAGRLSKAKRGELVHHLPTGLLRTEDGKVILDPDQSVRERTALVFAKFFELGTVRKVLRYLAQHELKLPRRQTSGLYAGQIVWKDACGSTLHSILKNPAYAGAFAYGRRTSDPARQVAGRSATGRLRRSSSEWIALVKDVYPAYITWEQYEQIQATIAENRQRMEHLFARKRGIRGGAALLTGLVRCGHCSHAMHVAYEARRFQYVCNGARNKYAKPSCQYLTGRAIDEAVLKDFFEALRPIEIDALERVTAKQAERHGELVHHLEQEAARLDYEARRAEKQYQCVDPENRLIAATLEKRWEAALEELEQARARLADARQTIPAPLVIPRELREAFVDAGRRLPEVWDKLSLEVKKSLLRTLVSRVNLRRRPDATVQIRLVWRGGLVSERVVRIAVFTLRDTEHENKHVQRIRQLSEEGMTKDQIAERLNQEGFIPCRSRSFTPQIIDKLKHRHGIVSNVEKARRGKLTSAYTLPEMASLLKVERYWIYGRIAAGTIKIKRDPRYGCYLFPNDRRTIEQLKRLKSHKVQHVSIQSPYSSG
jgi:DNA invertase Pin-like site-specific DNA recombinase